MPDPATVSAIAGASAQFTNVGANTIGQILTNRKNRKFSREMYERTKQDNIAFWNMQNEYNTPSNQMKRFQEAGLNPHLIYGQGNSGNASPVSTPDVQSAQARAPEFNLDGAAVTNSYFDTKIKQAQYDNLRAQNTVILEDANLKEAQTRATTMQAIRGEFDYGVESDLRDTSMDYRREALRQRTADIDISIRRDAREAAQNSSNIEEAAARIATMRQQRAQSRAEVNRIKATVENLKKDGIMKDLDIELYQDGIRPHDPAWVRVVGRFLESYFNEDNNRPGGIIKNFFNPSDPNKR